ncbi:class F sortase [Actinoplanes sp. NPDC026619]|uniref:class F sortase n=1 Tax=Actinoplanes sp. NPDC026619 TaxID=3155798 RepID=UPI0033EE437D
MTVEERDGEMPTELARGVVYLDSPGDHPARGVAMVPGALSVPRRRVIWPPMGPPRVLFERAAPPSVLDPPPIRRPAPGDDDGERVGETAMPGAKVGNPVRKKGSLRRLGRRAALPAATAALAAFVVGTTYIALTGRAQATDPDLGRWAASAPVNEPAVVQGAGNAGRPPEDPFGGVTVLAQGVPTRVRVAAVGLDSSLETLHVANGVLQAPKRFDRAGWYADGTAPGDIGPAVIAGHVDSKAGPAIFYRLRELTAGDKIEVVRGGQVQRFVVTRTAWYPKKAFPTSEVYGPTPDRQLRLITCGGVFDHKLRSYKDNLVVYAVAG